MKQKVVVSIVGVDITLDTTVADVQLAKIPGSKDDWVGTLPPVRVVDARGVPDGWEVRWELDHVEIDGEPITARRGISVAVAPSEPLVICCEQETVHAGPKRSARPGGRVLFGAEPGTGGGTFDVDASVTARLPRSIDAQSVVVHLTFAFH